MCVLIIKLIAILKKKQQMWGLDSYIAESTHDAHTDIHKFPTVHYYFYFLR